MSNLPYILHNTNVSCPVIMLCSSEKRSFQQFKKVGFVRLTRIK